MPISFQVTSQRLFPLIKLFASSTHIWSSTTSGCVLLKLLLCLEGPHSLDAWPELYFLQDFARGSCSPRCLPRLTYLLWGQLPALYYLALVECLWYVIFGFAYVVYLLSVCCLCLPWSQCPVSSFSVFFNIINIMLWKQEKNTKKHSWAQLCSSGLGYPWFEGNDNN